MKTPREMLFGRHKAVEPKLDDIRQDIVAELNNKDGASRTARKAQRFSDRLVAPLFGLPNVAWRELVLPSRMIWTGLAAVWLLILTANFSMRDHSAIKMAKQAPEIMMTFRQQQQMLSQLLGPDGPPIAEAKKSYLPRPASERRVELLMT
jgi:hypothetical protein